MGGVPEEAKKTKIRGGWWLLEVKNMGGGVLDGKKNVRGGGVPEEVKKTKIRDGGLVEVRNTRGGGGKPSYIFFRYIEGQP